MNPQQGRTPPDGALGLTLYNENTEDMPMVLPSESHTGSETEYRVIKIYPRDEDLPWKKNSNQIVLYQKMFTFLTTRMGPR